MASLNAMPFLVINLGAEMIFILEQRLQAQNVAKEKSTRVMQDVLSAMFAPHFLEELFRPQHLYTTAGVREIFDNLAQASIMRLSENSMDKLYELMITGTKQAFATARHPNDLIEVTLNHLDSLRALVGDAFAPLNSAVSRFTDTAVKLSVGELANVLKTLLTFFSAKKIKVTLFLQEKLQNPDGSFNITLAGPTYQHPAVEAPGAIRYFAADGQTVTNIESFAPAATAAGGNIAAWGPNPKGNATAVNPFIASQRTTALGRNIFLTERKKDADLGNSSSSAAVSPNTPSSATSDAAKARAASTTLEGLQGSGTVHPNAAKPPNSLAGIAAATATSNSTATASNPAGKRDMFKISNMFGEDDGVEGADTPIDLPTQQVVKITAGDDLNAELNSLKSGFDVATTSSASKKAKTEEEELLDLIS